MVHIKIICFFLIYSSALGLSTGLQDIQSSLRHVGSNSLTRDRTQVLATEPAGKFLKKSLKGKKKGLWIKEIFKAELQDLCSETVAPGE